MEKEKNAEISYKRNEEQKKDWKKIHEERKAQKRKWKEEKLLKKMEKEAKRQKEQEDLNLENASEKKGGRLHTLSIALPGSILDNAQSPELRTYLAGQIARAAVIFNIDEIIIFDEVFSKESSVEGQFQGIGKKGQANIQMARILQYLECPQYLRKSFFPHHKDLQYAGILNPLDSPHHMRAEDELPYREGVVLNKPVKAGRGSLVNCGLGKQDVQIDKLLQPGVRVTVRINQYDPSRRILKGRVVSPSAPREDMGLYWGYSVRLAKSLGTVFTESPYEEGYDFTIGTSEKGDSVDTVKIDKTDFRHALIVFGGVQGLEASLESDEALGMDDPSLLFQYYVNTCPHQGSRTIRTEEAILISLASLRTQLQGKWTPQ
ncbi:putative methyltransferase C9orf114 homolog [Ostrea edulis]|uniref:putative methyltransferase C9orf114 homolog n=1 Tax=Ostrea edulis TaxID=37623 RepID=UPI0024AEFD9E|nr:putative methyltransferase C9orf114 homolog [Ostrea edulis]